MKKKQCPKCKSKRTEYDGYEFLSIGSYPINHCRKCGFRWKEQNEFEPTEDYSSGITTSHADRFPR